MLISRLQYLRLLEQWVNASKTYLYTQPDRQYLVCYGTGYNNWGVQTNQKALAAFAVLAVDPDLNEDNAGTSRTEILEYALKMLRFSLESHIEGSFCCTDATSWGHTWISVLGIERMMHAVEAIEDHLTGPDHRLLRKVVLSECDWLLDEYEVAAGRIQNNRPESNLWNGAILHRAATMYPDAPRSREYKEKGTAFLINSISVASDAESDAIVDGIPVSALYVGDNFFESYACNHHGYLNVGYMVICLSNLAMLHFMYKRKGLQAPEALYHHAADLWKLVKTCTFPDGRLLRIGGDTRVRYCYCQDYAVPMWLMMYDKFHDPDCIRFEAGWLNQVEKECSANNDGAFLSGRCRELKQSTALYYTRIESDRAVTLSMAAYWRRIFKFPENSDSQSQISWPLAAWHDSYHGACLNRGEKRFVSWTWHAAEPPQGLCLPPDAGNLAEWRYNLAGVIEGIGKRHHQVITSHDEALFEGGFLTWGSVDISAEVRLESHANDEMLATKRIVFAALPDDATAVVLQYACAAEHRVFLRTVKGLMLYIPNDIFNGNFRTFYTALEKRKIQGFGSNPDVINLESSWINVEERLDVIALYGAEPSMFLVRPGRRQIGIRDSGNVDIGAMLYADEICFPCMQTLHSFDARSMLFDIGCVVRSGITAEETRAFVDEGRGVVVDTRLYPDIRAVMVTGVDGIQYLLLAHFGENPVPLCLRLPKGNCVTSLISKQAVSLNSDHEFSFTLRGGGADLFIVS